MATSTSREPMVMAMEVEAANEIARRVDAALGDHLEVTPGHGTSR